jgi:hypothetical protein
MSQFILNQAHPIIPREQNYVLDRKIISIHSTDRDISKWPKANHFSIDLPADITNVQSMRLVEIQLPNSHYVFTNAYQNTKLKFKLHGIIKKTHTIIISEGSYTAEELAIEIATKMNQAIAVATNNPYNSFVCAYNSVTNTFWFGNNASDALKPNFTLLFGEHIPYDIPCGQPDVWDHYSQWGLPAYLGYCKKSYPSSVRDASAEYHDLSGGFGFDYACTKWLIPTTGTPVHVVDISGGTDASGGNCCQLDIYGEKAIYMEIEKYNSIDELEPWSEHTSGMFNNDYAGKVDCAFAKIPIGLANAFSLLGDSKQFYLMNSTVFSPPIERIKRLRFTFRFHDGRRVEFKCVPFNFSLEINMLRDEQLRAMNVRIPVSFIS